MRALLTDIELDIQELKYLMLAYSHEPNEALRELLKRNILQMRSRLDEMLHELQSEQGTVEVNVESAHHEEIISETTFRVEEDISADSPITLKEENESKEVIGENKETIQISTAPILGECIKQAADLRHLISLNDSFRFSREMFNGDSELMSRVLEQISAMSNLEAAVMYLGSKIDVNEEDEAVADFLELLKKYFN